MKYEKTQLIKSLKKDEVINDIFVVKFKKPVQSYSNDSKYRFELRLGDSSGEIMLKYWGGTDKQKVEQIYDSIKQDDVIFVQGRVGEWNGIFDISCNQEDPALKVLTTDEYDLSDFIRKTERDIEEMYSEILNIIESIENGKFKQLLKLFFDESDFAKKFKKQPAAMYMHQGWEGGLLEHTLNVVEICLNTIKIHPQLNKDLLLTGAILHDIGKMEEFKVTSNIKTTSRGMLKGHIVLGLQILLRKIEELDIDELDKTKLIHMMISHHGNLEYGSPKIPSFPEAVALYHADEMDAKVASMIDVRQNAETEDDFMYDKNIKQNVFLK